MLVATDLGGVSELPAIWLYSNRANTNLSPPTCYAAARIHGAGDSGAWRVNRSAGRRVAREGVDLLGVKAILDARDGGNIGCGRGLFRDEAGRAPSRVSSCHGGAKADANGGR